MNICVLIKQVPDTETRIKVDGNKISEAGIKWILSPFDEHALEEALRIREKTGGTITAVSLGPARTVEALRTAFALGVDRAVHLVDEEYNVLDVGYTAGLLAGFLKKEEMQIILTGNNAIDSQSSMVPAMVARYLDCPNINNVLEVQVQEAQVICRKEIEGGSAVMKSSFPVVITAAKGLNEPRYPSLKGIMASKKKKIETTAAAELAGDFKGSRIEILSMEPPPERPPGRIVEGDSPEAIASQLVRLLRDEAKII